MYVGLFFLHHLLVLILLLHHAGDGSDGDELARPAAALDLDDPDARRAADGIVHVFVVAGQWGRPAQRDEHIASIGCGVHEVGSWVLADVAGQSNRAHGDVAV